MPSRRALVVVPPPTAYEPRPGPLDVLKKVLRVVLSVISVLMLLLFIATLFMGANFFFGTPLNMELAPVASPSPYPAYPPWEEQLAIHVPWAKIWFFNVTLEEGDVLIVRDLNTGATWSYTSNGTDVLTDAFYAGGDGYVRLSISIEDDGDGITSYGVFGFLVTDIWSLVLTPYLLLFIYAIQLPDVPAWVLAALLQAIFVFCFIASAVSSRGYHRALIDSYGKPLKRAMSNFLYAFPFIATASLTGWFILNLIVTSIGFGTEVKGELPGPIFLLLEVSYAVVIEEVFFRVLLIGLPMGIAALLAGRGATTWSGPSALSVFLKGLLCPGALDRDIRRRVRPLAWIMVLFSSAIFGLAHVMTGAWEAGKAITAGAIGLVLGACFVCYGVYASILVHWFFNYHVQVWYVWAVRSRELVALLTAGLIIMVELAIGALSLLMFFVQGIRMLLRRRKPSYPPPTWPPYQPTALPPAWAQGGRAGPEVVGEQGEKGRGVLLGRDGEPYPLG